MEIWKDVEGYENLYQISNLGNVRSLNYRNKGLVKNLTQTVNQYGYKTVILRKDGMQKNFKVHRLVAIAFLSRVKDRNIVNHKDGNKLNNCLMNLEILKQSTHRTNHYLDGDENTTVTIYKGTRKDLSFEANYIANNYQIKFEKNGDLLSVSADKDNIVIETIKDAEDGNGIIVRAYETWNSKTKATLTFCDDIKEATECNLIEDGADEVKFNGKSLETEFKPFEIKTFRVNF